MFEISPIKADLVVSSLKRTPVECGDFKDFYTQLFYIILKKTGKISAWKSVEEKCSSTFPPDLQLMKNILDSSGMSLKQIEVLAKQFQLEESTANYLKLIISKKEKRVSFNFKRVEEYLNLVRESKDMAGVYYANKTFMTFLKQSKSYYYEKLFTPLVALNAGNESWFYSSLNELLMTDPRRVYFEHDSMTQEQSLAYKELTRTILKKYLDRINLNYEKIAFSLFLSHFSFSENFYPEATIEDVKNVIKSERKSRLLYPLWLYGLYQKGPSSDFINYFNSVTNLENLDRIEVDQFQIFELSWPTNDIKREVLVSKLINLSKKEDEFSTFIFSSLVANDVIRSSFSQSNNKVETPQFSLSRKFYKNSLEEGLGGIFSLYNLISIGDLDKNYLWWLVL